MVSLPSLGSIYRGAEYTELFGLLAQFKRLCGISFLSPILIPGECDLGCM